MTPVRWAVCGLCITHLLPPSLLLADDQGTAAIFNNRVEPYEYGAGSAGAALIIRHSASTTAVLVHRVVLFAILDF